MFLIFLRRVDFQSSSLLTSCKMERRNSPWCFSNLSTVCQPHACSPPTGSVLVGSPFCIIEPCPPASSHWNLPERSTSYSGYHTPLPTSCLVKCECRAVKVLRLLLLMSSSKVDQGLTSTLYLAACTWPAVTAQLSNSFKTLPRGSGWLSTVPASLILPNSSMRLVVLFCLPDLLWIFPTCFSSTLCLTKLPLTSSPEPAEGVHVVESEFLKHFFHLLRRSLILMWISR